MQDECNARSHPMDLKKVVNTKSKKVSCHCIDIHKTMPLLEVLGVVSHSKTHEHLRPTPTVIQSTATCSAYTYTHTEYKNKHQQ